MTDSRRITGHTYVAVKLAKPEGAEVHVFRGHPLPDGLAEGELERLEAAGAFDPPKVADLAGQGASLAITATKPPAPPANPADDPAHAGPLLDTGDQLPAAPPPPAPAAPSAPAAPVAPAPPPAPPAPPKK